MRQVVMRTQGLRALGCLTAWLPLASAAPPPGIALVGVHVVDVITGQVARDRTLVISDGRIVAVQASAAALPSNIKIIPSHGRYAVPGFWDMHVHIADANYLDLFVANGVTGVRDMGGGLDTAGDGCESLKPTTLLRWRSEIAAGKRVGPELVIAGPAVSGSGWPTSLPARNLTEAVAAIAALKRHQVDFVKIHDGIPMPAYRVLTSEAKRTGLPLAGHVPEAVGPLTALRSGQRSIEHIRDALLTCFTADRRELDRFFAEDRWGSADKAWGRRAHADCPQIVSALRDGAAWLTPTLTVEKAKVLVEDPRHVADPRRALLPQSVRDGYASYAREKLGQSKADRASEHLWWRTQQKLVHRMSRMGVKLLAGTDSACQGGLPGISLHEEMKELVAAGLSPAAALRAATIEPARYLGRTDEGRLAAGNRANVVLLEANPLDNIENSKRIDAVLLKGRVMVWGNPGA